MNPLTWQNPGQLFVAQDIIKVKIYSVAELRMNTFLHYIAKELIDKYGCDLSHTAVVFPNKRASLFLNEELARYAGKPVWAPTYLTISDLFRKYSELTVGDPIKLVCELYNSYIQVTGKDEPLDHFYDWGRLLISDFDDIDKNMADAEKVFSNIANLHELDDISYLSDEQKEILATFFSNFTDGHNTKLKELFLSLWNKLYDIYTDYKSRLRKQGIAYEGMLYRDVVEGNMIKTEYDRYAFVGFNMLQSVERMLFQYLKSEGKADFYWDYDYYYMPTKDGTKKEAGRYIASYLKTFGDSFSEETKQQVFDNFKKEKSISFVKAKTENIQARYVAQWLRENDRYKDGKRTAIVMCDEGILQSVVHCIPEEVNDINVTTGYPLAQSPVASLVSQLLDLHIVGKRKDGGFRYQYVKAILNHPYSEYYSANSHALLEKLRAERNVFPTQKDLAMDDNLKLLFSERVDNSDILQLITHVLSVIATKDKSSFYQEAVFQMYCIMNRLKDLVDSGELQIDQITLQKLVKQLILTTSIPFHGEPAIGIQIMGVLETRNLDFDHLLILSCNEGNMPKGIRDSSFIPYSIRKAYNLTTVDNKVAIFSYYFYRLLQRAKDITIVYNTSTENGNRGEMSRFMLQLMVESGHKIDTISLHAGQNILRSQNGEIAKDERTMHILDEMKSLSPTALNKYLRCQLQFYYNYICGIKEPDDDLEDGLTNRAFGNVFHHVSEELYKDICKSGRMVTEEVIEKLSEKSHIEQIVDRMFQREIYGDDEKKWKKINYNGMQLINREVIIRYVSHLLEIDKALTPFNILALEKGVYDSIDITTKEGTKSIRIGGSIDRLDAVTDRKTGRRRIRVVDYKTGAKEVRKPVSEVGDIFDPTFMSDDSHTDYYLQSMLYSLIVRNDATINPGSLPVSPSLLFIQRTFNEGYDPTISIGKEKVKDIAIYAKEFRANLAELINDIYNKDLPFMPTDNATHCQFCPYRGLCGK